MHRKVAAAWTGLAIFLTAPLRTAPGAAPATEAANDSRRLSLVLAAGSLANLAIHRAYGIAWQNPRDSSSDPAHDPRPRVDLRRGYTPAAALVLLRAGRCLNNSALVQDAMQAAAGLADCQNDAGRIPESAIFAQFPAGRDRSPGARDRSSTVAALGLFLEILQDPQDAASPTGIRVRGAAMRCANWLTRQELRDGSWWTDIDHAQPIGTTRGYRLDTPDWRNCTLILFDAAQTLDRQDARHDAEGAADALVRMRLDDPQAPWAQGWASVYLINGLPDKNVREEPYALDATATLWACQTLIGSVLLTHNTEDLSVLTDVAAAMKPLQRPDCRWYRLYGLPTSSLLPATRPPDAIPRLFSQPPTTQEDQDSFAPRQMSGLLRTIAALSHLNFNPLALADHPLPAEFSNDRVLSEIAAMAVGLDDEPFCGQAPDVEATPLPQDELSEKISATNRLLFGFTSQDAHALK